MLSIGKIAPGQHRYYQQQVAKGRDDYYSGKGEAPADWAGTAAAKLGLRGKVSPEQFEALIAGIDPSDPKLERQLNPRAKSMKVAAYDLTFSAPKSVSVLFATADARTATTMIEAHESAVAAALDYIEDTAVSVRRGRNGVTVQKGDGLLAAAYRHRMSRATDPQLHTHVVCANLSQSTEDGRWTGMWGSPLFQHAKAAGTLYQAHLRAEIRDRLGLEWGAVVKGQAELEAIDGEVLEAFSQRRQRMKELALAGGMGLDTKARAEAAALGTRDRKQYDIDTVIWREEIQARAAELGLDETAIDALLVDGRLRLQVDGPAPDIDLQELADALTGAHGLTNVHNSFGMRDAVIEVASAHQQGVRAPIARQRVDVVIGRSDVHSLSPNEHSAHDERRFTTEDLVTVERNVVSSAIRRAGAGTAAVPDRVLKAALEGADRPLNEQQAAAVRGVAASGNGVDVIEALAGTGKTYTAGVLRDTFERAGHHVIGVGPTGRAVRELSDDAGIRSWTIDSLQHQADQGRADLAPGSVIILDEAGMTSTRKIDWLMRFAENAEAKVVAIGDSGQLPSVEAGGWLAAIGDRLGRHELTDVIRQRSVAEKRVLGLLHAGEPDAYVEWLADRQRLHVHLEPAEALEQAVGDWTSAMEKHGASEAVLIARNNDTRAVLNSRARAVMVERRMLGAELVYGETEIAVGERVIARQNDVRLEVANGTRGTVRYVGASGIVLKTDSGALRALPADYVADHVEHAYALTGHGMQGGTVDWAGVVGQPREFTRGWSYTALSRARHDTHIYVQAVDPLEAADRADIAPHDAADDRTQDLVIEEVTARMIVRDDEDLAVDDLSMAEAVRDDQDLVHDDLDAEMLIRDDDLSLLEARTDAQDLAPQPEPTAPLASDAAPLTDGGGAPPHERITRTALARERLLTARRKLQTGTLLRFEGARDGRRLTVQQRDDLVRRLERLPDPPAPRRWRTPDDLHAVERARLASGVQAATEQIEATDAYIEELRARLGEDPVRLRAEVGAIDAQLQALDEERTAAIDELAELEVKKRPTWARRELGDRPADPRTAGAWDSAVRVVARARLREDPEREVNGLGDAPTDRDARAAWVEAKEQLERTRESLGRGGGGPAGPELPM